MVFVTGDLHGNFERFKPKYFPEQARMTKQDTQLDEVLKLFNEISVECGN